MDACNKKVDVLKIPFWPFIGGEQGEYFFHFFINTLYMLMAEIAIFLKIIKVPWVSSMSTWDWGPGE